jgi:hypothetical protein
VLALPEGRVVEDRPLPPGYSIRVADEADYRPAWEVVEDAFLEWSVRDRQGFEDFMAGVAGPSSPMPSPRRPSRSDHGGSGSSGGSGWVV